MAPKRKPVPFKDEMTGVACTSYPNFKIWVGVGSDGITLAKKFSITMRNDETPVEAVSRYRDKILAALNGVAEAGTLDHYRYPERAFDPSSISIPNLKHLHRSVNR